MVSKDAESSSEAKEKAHRLKFRDIDPEFVQKALRSGLYRRRNNYSDFYIQWRMYNHVIPIRKELIYEQDFIEEKIELLKNLDYTVLDFNYKKCIGGYILQMLCPKNLNRNYIPNGTYNICVRFV